ncbi:thiol:disulfide interchange protein DsbA/DsbL [Kitasatospora terrestris]|uniref:Thiol:disulfide interchange protein DsbA n=1 Tax=Kitasatospora terrestris TaxID=258051 RepID=A0ABP9DGC8_9ACTN
MKLLLRSTALLAAAAGLLGNPAGAAAAPAEPHGGAHVFGHGHPQPVRQVAVRREAVEFFWYDCYHSAELEQPLTGWAAQHHDDVVLRRVPAVWPGSGDEQVQTAHARLYYTLERLGEADRLQQSVYRAVREQHADLTTEDRAADWAVGHGLSASAFRAAYRSAEVERATAEAPELFTRNRITELPTVIVDGRYRTSPTEAGGVEQMPSALDRVLDTR